MTSVNLPCMDLPFPIIATVHMFVLLFLAQSRAAQGKAIRNCNSFSWWVVLAHSERAHEQANKAEDQRDPRIYNRLLS